MKRHILVTGGAGFIGSHLVDKLVELGHNVRIFDNIEPQVHPNGKVPSYLNKKAEFIKGDVTNIDEFEAAIKDIDIIFHQAALVGVGQSMYQIKRYMMANTIGTANLMELLANKKHSVKKVIVASSMSTYGEGLYECEKCGKVNPDLRPENQMKSQDWEMHCPNCNMQLRPLPTDESKKQEINSIYALTKKDQEDMVLNTGKTYGIPSVALRYFNVYGPRQSLSNPYTGVAAIFISRIKNNNSPTIYEDGLQSRDFVSVHDIVQANILAMEKSSADYDVFNVGTGSKYTVKEIADILIKLLKKDLKPEIIGKFRKGDIRHCFADISKIKNKLGYNPKISFEQGMKELIEWAEKEQAKDLVNQATKELKDKGLVI
ncbi:nucleoside-diphosphate-sugar epimerase [Candidatus Woesearchaeota archaeon CG10_big_fil_rev_8_21_14_0_10_33_12]|nr:MAG: nucleoside-diphosphate-sugar epimerase [Candidatus Woesearchaeota archaeon CG10_big_fil_rev_8_21_14_0_10_33_12]